MAEKTLNTTTELIEALKQIRDFAEKQKTAGVELAGGVYSDTGLYNREHEVGGSFRIRETLGNQFIEDPIIPAIDSAIVQLEKVEKLDLPAKGVKAKTGAMVINSNLGPFVKALKKINNIQVEGLEGERKGPEPVELIENAVSYQTGLYGDNVTSIASPTGPASHASYAG